MEQDTSQKLEYHPEGLDSTPSHNRFRLLRKVQNLKKLKNKGACVIQMECG